MHRMYVQSSLAVKKSLAEICHFKSVKNGVSFLADIGSCFTKKKS